MSNDRAAVFRTTKVRTKLRGDGSWLQQQDEPDAETQEEEKPWLADVRARRLNGAPIDTSPVSSPVKTTPPPVKSDTESKPSTQGYLIRGVFTKLDNPVSSPSYNGPSKPKLFTKRPSESYKKIAPHTVRSSSENPEDQLSPEEQEKRKEAAISVLKKKPSKRSYVLSAAKLYEDKDTSPETSPASSSPSFVAKRVEIVDDSKSAPTPSPASTVAPYPAVPPTSAASTPAPKPQTAVNTTVKTTDESAVKEPVNPKATNPPAKLNEVKDILPDTTLANSSPLFVAKRVEVVDDSKKAAPPAPSSTVASSAASTPAPKPQTAVNTTVKTTDESTVKEPVNVKSTSPAAKLNEAKDTSPDSTLASSSPSFVAKRVEIVDDSKSAPTPSPASTVAPYPAVPPTSAASTPAPKPQTAVNTTVKTTDESAVKEPVNPKATNPPPKLNEVKDILPDTTLANSSPLFVAKRVEVVDDSKKAAPPAPSSTVASSPAVPPTSAASTPAPKPQTAVNTTVKTTDESAVKELANPKATNLPAKLNEAKDTSPDTTLASSSPSFLTKKVEIINDSKSAPTPAPASTVAPYPAVPPISAASTPAPKPQTAVNTTVKTTDESVVKELANPKATNLPAVPEKEEPLLQSNAEKQQTEDKKTKSNNTTITGSVRVATTAPQTKAETPLVKLLPSSKTSPAQKSVGSDSPALTSTVTVPPVPVPRSAPTTASPAPVTPVPVLTVAELMVKTEPEQEPELKDEAEAEPEDEPEVEHELEPSAEPSADDKLELAEEEEGSVDSQTPENMAVDEPIPVETELLVDYSGPKEPAKTYQRISHEMVNLICSEPSPAKASDTLDLLANDVDIVHTEGHSLSIQQQKEEKEKQTDETAVETQSLADPFDPYPIGTASHNSSTTPEGKKSSSPEVTSAAADLSQLSWTTKWEIPKQTNTEESQEAATEDQSGDQQTVIKFEKKSTEIDSPWNRWTSPTVYTISNTTGDEDKEEEEVKEEESPEDSQKVTTITTVREIQNEPEPTMAQSASPSTALIEEERRVPTPESETKKPFVYVKEYVNASDMALLNSSSDDFASSSINYLYSSPSSYTRVSLSSSCMYCGKQVDNNAKITIEHLNINCHPECFKCDVCSKPMGDLLHGMFLHQKKVYCESCYATVI
ncbi:zinc finger protein 185 isoform X3 [Girardinichthys multiradiatus]|uniref:zinc finger protein 185 isoform X3 n=1 Tax=Girardinichthys multiradiatus TaxID=208333 RepID=UPI001FADE6BC|nr:zinc finger protein 185 isoform X3 [Girardinichthys multiradiatus]